MSEEKRSPYFWTRGPNGCGSDRTVARDDRAAARPRAGDAGGGCVDCSMIRSLRRRVGESTEQHFLCAPNFRAARLEPTITAVRLQLPSL